ncbi:hypothetical protein HPB50_012694 [Hyalomma asiaticum]|uniref:Uncharacterized protein n=1 Tax=Hyalomma asiaticum TaxID=266040 RepID=A0ACB7SHB3_HYAAI|nr:hypothetical protein HPB50_012694 [Hyalomma asiaticum]
MDVQTEGEGTDHAMYKPSEWTPIIRAYKGGQPRPETQVVPSRSVPVSAKPTASAVGAPADAASASPKPTYHAQQKHLRAARAVALRRKQLPLLPPGTIRVVFRPRGGLALNGAMAQPLLRALQVAAAGRDLGELHLRIHPTNNTFTVATYHETSALHLVQLKEVVLQKTSYPVAAYIAPPPAAVAKKNSTTSQDSEMKALREEVSQLRAALSTPTLPPVSQPPSLLTPSDQPPQKKRRPDESPAQPIDMEAKFQDLAQNLEAKFTERITAQVTAQCQIMIEATITRIMESVVFSIMTKVEERLAHLTIGLSSASPPAAKSPTPLLRPSTLQHGSSDGP